ncbi:MAG: hypothetical protein IJV27_09970 [Prevotella sp.]|nr:hypothetical protein [Prevotella sp.]
MKIGKESEQGDFPRQSGADWRAGKPVSAVKEAPLTGKRASLDFQRSLT